MSSNEYKEGQRVWYNDDGKSSMATIVRVSRRGTNYTYYIRLDDGSEEYTKSSSISSQPVYAETGSHSPKNESMSSPVLSPISSPLNKTPEEYKKGQPAWYDGKRKCLIAAVHRDDPTGLYYTINFEDGTEKQTDGAHLSHNHIDTLSATKKSRTSSNAKKTSPSNKTAKKRVNFNASVQREFYNKTNSTRYATIKRLKRLNSEYNDKFKEFIEEDRTDSRIVHSTCKKNFEEKHI